MVKLGGGRWGRGSQRLLAENDRFDLWLAACTSSQLETWVHLALKLVSVKLVGLGRAFPTFSFGFWSPSASAILHEGVGHMRTWKSFFLSFFFLALEPILTAVDRQYGPPEVDKLHVGSVVRENYFRLFYVRRESLLFWTDVRFTT